MDKSACPCMITHPTHEHRLATRGHSLSCMAMHCHGWQCIAHALRAPWPTSEQPNDQTVNELSCVTGGLFLYGLVTVHGTQKNGGKMGNAWPCMIMSDHTWPMNDHAWDGWSCTFSEEFLFRTVCEIITTWGHSKVVLRRNSSNEYEAWVWQFIQIETMLYIHNRAGAWNWKHEERVNWCRWNDEIWLRWNLSLITSPAQETRL